MKASLILVLTTASTASAFAPTPIKIRCGQRTALLGQKKGFIANFFDELDAFVDDATNRRLGNGAAFYGKRKSAFYGEEDFMKKDDKDIADPTEDYQGPKKAGYFQWMPDENGQLRPVTRLKKKNIERNPNFWDKAFDDDN